MKRKNRLISLLLAITMVLSVIPSVLPAPVVAGEPEEVAIEATEADFKLDYSPKGSHGSGFKDVSINKTFTAGTLTSQITSHYNASGIITFEPTLNDGEKILSYSYKFRGRTGNGFEVWTFKGDNGAYYGTKVGYPGGTQVLGFYKVMQYAQDYQLVSGNYETNKNYVSAEGKQEYGPLHSESKVVAQTVYDWNVTVTYTGSGADLTATVSVTAYSTEDGTLVGGPYTNTVSVATLNASLTGTYQKITDSTGTTENLATLTSVTVCPAFTIPNWYTNKPENYTNNQSLEGAYRTKMIYTDFSAVKSKVWTAEKFNTEFAQLIGYANDMSTLPADPTEVLADVEIALAVYDLLPTGDRETVAATVEKIKDIEPYYGFVGQYQDLLDYANAVKPLPSDIQALLTEIEKANTDYAALSSANQTELADELAKINSLKDNKVFYVPALHGASIKKTMNNPKIGFIATFSNIRTDSAVKSYGVVYTVAQYVTGGDGKPATLTVADLTVDSDKEEVYVVQGTANATPAKDVQFMAETATISSGALGLRLIARAYVEYEDGTVYYSENATADGDLASGKGVKDGCAARSVLSVAQSIMKELYLDNSAGKITGEAYGLITGKDGVDSYVQDGSNPGVTVKWTDKAQANEGMPILEFVCGNETSAQIYAYLNAKQSS